MTVIKKQQPTFYFVGVTTGGSSINRVFPLWMEVLGRPEIVLEGIDHPLGDDPQNYRETVAQFKGDENSLGGLVTTHKMDLFAAAEDMFDWIDPYAEVTREVSCISKRDGKLRGHAKDPISAGKSLDSILPPGYFGETGAHVLCLGSGGAAVATTLHLINKMDAADRPEKIIVVDIAQGRIDHLRELADKYDTDIAIRSIVNADPKRNDQLMADLPDHSLVINATGMGKDRPGSPITDDGRFPRNGIAWEFNYRGDLDFMHQARRQADKRGLRVEDGWVYFLHGWSQVVYEVLDIDPTPDLFGKLDEAASQVRG